ncbi:MAG: hypothetical protein V1878_06485 [bacterium]
MRVNGHLTGMRGVYLVASELSRLGFIASPTSRSAIGADILVTDQKCKRTYSVQVKTNAKPASFWLVGAKAREIHSKTHIYVLVNIHSKKDAEVIEYYIVPSKVVASTMVSAVSKTDAKSEWHQVNKVAIARYLGKWSVFGAATDMTERRHR